MTILGHMKIKVLIGGFTDIQRIKGFLKRPISIRAVLAFLAVTLLATVLFWKSQSSLAEDYSTMVLNLSEFKYFDAKLDQQLVQMRNPQVLDSMRVLSVMGVLADIGGNLNSFTMDQMEANIWFPESLVIGVDRELRSRIHRTGILLRDRSQALRKLDSLESEYRRLLGQKSTPSKLALAKLDSLRAIRQGYRFILESQDSEMHQISRQFERQSGLVEELLGQQLQIRLDDLIRAYRFEIRKALEIKDRINMSFYLSSLLSLLVMVVLLVRIRR